jgi:glycosyltransferase involved in cell wall biosynthesis
MIDFDKYAELPLRDLKEDEKVTILFMAWVTRNKGIFELIEAVKMLRKENFNFKVIIAGKGDDYEKIKDELKAANLTEDVVLKGWVLGDQKLAILTESDIFVLPTYFDGYPNSLMEAMASGKACIATNVGSIPDMINNMETGVLIDKKNHNQLYQGLKVLIQNVELRKEMSIKARKQVEGTNSINSGISKFQNLFK